MNNKQDGVKDDTALIQGWIDEAIKTGKPIIIPAGTYIIKETLK